LVEALEVETKPKGAIFFQNEKHWSSMWAVRGMDEPCSKVLVNEILKNHKFLL